MPRILGVNIIGALLAAVVMFFVGFLFYGILFSEIWMASRGYTVDMFEGQSGGWMSGGFLIELVLAFGIGWVIKARGVKGVAGSVMTALTLALLIALPMLAYDFVYGAYHSVPGLLVDFGHTLVAFTLAGAVLSFFD